jgi:Flp pilus assembly protein TadD
MLDLVSVQGKAMTKSRSAAPFIALLLCGTALAGCASDDAAPPAPQQAQAADADILANPGNLADDIRHAQEQRAAHDLDGATRTLSQLMLMAPDDPRVVGEYGKVLAERGRAQEAVQFLTRATQLRSNDWSIYSALGVAEDQLGKLTDARAAYEQALALKPNEPSVLNNYALSRMLANDPATAQRLMAMAVAHGGGADPKIARNIALINSLAPQPAAPAPVESRPTPLHAPVAENLAPATQHMPAAPRVVMEAVPFDAKAGKVETAHQPAAHHVGHVRHVAKAAPKPAAKPVAVATAPKPAAKRAAVAATPKKALPVKAAKKDAPPALRMTADARTP